MLNPGAYMESAGLTSKEYAHRVRRDPIEEKLEDPVRRDSSPRVSTRYLLSLLPSPASLFLFPPSTVHELILPNYCQGKSMANPYLDTKADYAMYGRKVGGDPAAAKEAIHQLHTRIRGPCRPAQQRDVCCNRGTACAGA
jgi:hypothetical protein